MLVRRLEAVRDTLRRLAEPRGPRGTRRSRTSSIVELAEEVHSIIAEAEFIFAHAQYLSSTEDEADQATVKEEDKKALAVEVETTKHEASNQTSKTDAGVTPESTHAQVGFDGQATKRRKQEASSSGFWTRFAELGQQRSSSSGLWTRAEQIHTQTEMSAQKVFRAALGSIQRRLHTPQGRECRAHVLRPRRSASLSCTMSSPTKHMENDT